MKWLGLVAMAALIAGSCSQKQEPLVSDTPAAVSRRLRYSSMSFQG